MVDGAGETNGGRPFDTPRESVQHPVADPGLGAGGEGAVAVDPLAQLAGRAPPPPPVGHGEVVEHEQLARGERDLERRGGQRQAARGEERLLLGERGELGAAEKARLGLDARERRRLAQRGLDHAGQAALRVALGVVEGPVGTPVARESAVELRRRGPGAAREQLAQGDEPGGGADARAPGRDVQGGDAGHVRRPERHEREAEVDVQGLEVPARPAVRGRQRPLAEDVERIAGRQLGDRRLGRGPGRGDRGEGSGEVAVAHAAGAAPRAPTTASAYSTQARATSAGRDREQLRARRAPPAARRRGCGRGA